MLGDWQSHADYQRQTSTALSLIARTNPFALLEYEGSVSKLYILNLDPLKPIVAPLYSHTGRPSQHQPEIFRSLIMMNDLGFSLDEWIVKLSNNHVLQIACGFVDKLPGIASYYDFMSRIVKLDEKPRVKSKERKPKKKYGKNKMPSKRKGAVALSEFRDLYPNLTVDTFVSDSASDNYATYVLLDKWNINAVIAMHKTNDGNRTFSQCVVNKDGFPICPGGHEMVNWGLNSNAGFARNPSRFFLCFTRYTVEVNPTCA